MVTSFVVWLDIPATLNILYEMIKIMYEKMLNLIYLCILMHQMKVTHKMFIPTNLEQIDRGSSYLLSSKIYLVCSSKFAYILYIWLTQHAAMKPSTAAPNSFYQRVKFI